MEKPRVINGICEFCGTPADTCAHSRLGVPSTVAKQGEFKIDLYRKLSNKERIADIIIPHHNRHDHLQKCLEQLPNDIFNIIVVSGGSFAANCNKGAKMATTDNIIILNDDTVPNYSYLIEACEQKGDIIGFPQYIPSEDKTFYGVEVWEDNDTPNGWKAKLTEEASKVMFPGGFAFVVRRKVWEELGGFDEGFYNGGEDSDFFLNALNCEKQISYSPNVILHHHSQSDGRLTFAGENQTLLDEKWPKDNIFDVLRIKKKEYSNVKESTDKLKILVATNHLDMYAGSETWTYTMVNELRRLGHDVDIYTRQIGKIAEKIPGVYSGDIVKEREYDLILINHNTCLKDLENVKGYKIFTSHGVYPLLEQPAKGADAYVSVTPEVQRHMESQGFKSTVIYNGVDINRFKPVKSPNDVIKNVLCMCKGEVAAALVNQVCIKKNWEFKWIKGWFNTEEAINDSDIVFTLGRGAIEAMACGREVFILDSRAYMKQGIVGDGLFRTNHAPEIMEYNYSGRAAKRRFDIDTIIEELVLYNLKSALQNNAYAMTVHNVADKVNEYLKIYANRNYKSS